EAEFRKPRIGAEALAPIIVPALQVIRSQHVWPVAGTVAEQQCLQARVAESKGPRCQRLRRRSAYLATPALVAVVDETVIQRCIRIRWTAFAIFDEDPPHLFGQRRPGLAQACRALFDDGWINAQALQV